MTSERRKQRQEQLLLEWIRQRVPRISKDASDKVKNLMEVWMMLQLYESMYGEKNILAPPPINRRNSIDRIPPTDFGDSPPEKYFQDAGYKRIILIHRTSSGVIIHEDFRQEANNKTN